MPQPSEQDSFQAMKRKRELTEMLGWFCNLAQLLDGWHSDGTAWTEWDESVRKQLTYFQLLTTEMRDEL